MCDIEHRESILNVNKNRLKILFGGLFIEIGPRKGGQFLPQNLAIQHPSQQQQQQQKYKNNCVFVRVIN